jgi:CheY-like chemotaxis protein
MTMARGVIGAKGAIVCHGSWSEHEREHMVSELGTYNPEMIVMCCPGCTGWVEAGQTPGVLSDTTFPTTLISAFAQVQRIFVVDDDKQIAEVLSFVLRENGFVVETFYDARSASLRASDSSPDFLVSDIDMPEMNGVTLARALQAQNPICKVILISGNPDWKARRTLQGGGLEGFVLLPKPFSPSQLVRLIKLELS